MRSLALAAMLAAAAPALADEPLHQPIAGTELDLSTTGTVERAPDVVTIDAGVVTQAATAAAAMAQNAERMTATLGALRAAGVAPRDIRTASLMLEPRYRYDTNQPPVLTGYQASNRVTVRFRDLARVGGVLDALVKAGANQIDGPTFGVDKPEDALNEARTQALAQARARAELYARAAGLSVRRIVRISEDSNEMPRPVMAPMMMAMRKSADTPIAPGEQTLAVTLRVVFELG